MADGVPNGVTAATTYSVREASEALGIAEQTLYARLRKGYYGYAYKSGAPPRWRLTVADVYPDSPEAEQVRRELESTEPGPKPADEQHAEDDDLPPLPADPANDEEIYSEAEAKRRKSSYDAHIRRLDYLKKAGELVPVEEVQAVLNDVASGLVYRLQGLGQKHGRDADQSRQLQGDVNDALREFCDALRNASDDLAARRSDP